MKFKDEYEIMVEWKDGAWMVHGWCMDGAWMMHGWCMDGAWMVRG